MNPFIDKTYAEAISYIAEHYGDTIALTYGDRDYSFRDIKREADLASARLAALGVKPGETVALWITNRPEFAWLWLGAAQMGVIPVVLNTRLRLAEFQYQISQSESVLVFVPGPGDFRNFLSELADVCPAIREGELPAEPFPHLRKVVSLDPPEEAWPNVIDYTTLGSELPVPDYIDDPLAPGLIAYSSGTTSLPKGVMLSHCVWRKAHDIAGYLDLTPRDCLYLAVPLFGVFGFLNGLLVFWSQGSRIILRERFDAGDFIRTVRDDKCSFSQLMPAMVERTIRHPEFEIETMKTLRGGTLLSSRSEDLQRTIDMLDAPGFAPAYGLTETTGPVTRCRWDDPLEARLSHFGWPLPDCSIRIVGVETGEDLPQGEEGEILIRGYPVMLGYFRKAEQTAETILENGWLKTGDLGFQNPDGSLKFLRRIKDGYKHKGFNVSTPEVESAILKIPGIDSAAVVGIPDPEFGECGAAFIIPAKDAAPDPEEIINHLRNELASFKVPKIVFAVDSFPLTSGTDKVQKFKLRDMAIEKLGDRVEQTSK